MTIKNLTAHPITIDGFGTVKPSGIVVRVPLVRSVTHPREGIRVINQEFGEVEGLPAPARDTTFLVAPIVLSALKSHPLHSHRVGQDVFAPDTGPDAVKTNGRVTAVRGLVC